MAVVMAVVTAACSRVPAPFSRAESTSIARAGLGALFVDREQARSVLLWTGPLADAPTFGQKRLRIAATGGLLRAEALTLAHLDTAALHLPVPLIPVDLALLDAHFRANPAGWDTWFRRFPGASGIVEVGKPLARRDGAATMFVGRACGEHCHSAWRLVLSRTATETWRVDSVIPLRLPRS
ncbi:MAG: hypothetical protein V4617_12225 [Gemmatimonadota bacterium]